MTTPWQVRVAIVALAASLAPPWLTDLSRAPAAYEVRFWTTLVVGALIVGTALRSVACRMGLAVLLVIGFVAAGRALAAGGAFDAGSAAISLIQLAAMILLLTRPARIWFAATRPAKVKP